MTTSAASPSTTAKPIPLGIPGNFRPSAFTPLESFFLFQAIIKYGIEPDAFSRIAAVLQNNVYIRNDESFSAERLTADSLRQLFNYLLEEIARERSARPAGFLDDSKGQSSLKNDANCELKGKIPAEQLPVMVEHLYARYRDHIVEAIREDERRIERVQGEIRVLEQQAAGGGGRGAHARAIAAAGRQQAQAQAQAQAHAQAQAQAQAQAHAQATQQAAQAQHAWVQHAQAQAQVQAQAQTQAHAQAQQAQQVQQAQHAQAQLQPQAQAQAQAQAPAQAQWTGTPGPVPILPATSRPGTSQASSSTGPSPPASARVTASPTLQQQQQLQHQLQQIQQQQHRSQESSPHIPPKQLPSRTPSQQSFTTVTQPPPRANTATPSTASEAAPVGTPTARASQSAAAHQPTSLTPGQPLSRPISPAVAQQPPPPQTLQSLPPTLPASGKPTTTTPQVPPKVQTPIAPPVPPTKTPGTPAAPARISTPILASSPSKVSNQPQNQPQSINAAQPGQPGQPGQPTEQPAVPAVATPRPVGVVPSSQTPIASGTHAPLGFQSTPAPGAPTGTLSTPGPSGVPLGRPLLPEHLMGGLSSKTPTPIQSPHPPPPHTPLHTGIAATFLPRGSGTRWKPNDPSPSTPGPDVGDIASPAFEPLSPVHPSAKKVLSQAGSADGDVDRTASPSGTRASRAKQPTHTHSTRPTRTTRPSRHTQENTEAAEITDDDTGNSSLTIKAETTSPKPFDDEDDSVDVVQHDAPISSRLKRKRGDGDEDEDDADDNGDTLASSIEPEKTDKLDLTTVARRRIVGPPAPPSHVLWMRGFPKISASALDQISSHRHANMFAHKIRDRDAPGYSNIVRHPVDLKSIRLAITQGNKAAIQAAAALAEAAEASGDSDALAAVAPDMGSVWLPISEDLIPPRGIINSSQLECELVHMFANAVMYNPDSHRGPGPSFIVSNSDSDEDEDKRYEVDEDGVVNDTRDMYVEVEKLLTEMRSAERQRGAPAPPAAAKGLDLPLDDAELSAVLAAVERGDSSDNGDKDGDEGKDDGEKEEEHDSGEASGTIKRRRITRGQ